jgi:hypothetical protein
MVGDSIFPGQSTAAVALGGLRVARTILAGQNLNFASPRAGDPSYNLHQIIQENRQNSGISRAIY